MFNTGANGTTYGTASTLTLFQNGTFPDVRLGQDPGIGNCFNHPNPAWRPLSIATLAGGQLAPAQPPNDGFFEPVTFIGGVPPEPELDWTLGWTNYAQQ